MSIICIKDNILKSTTCPLSNDQDKRSGRSTDLLIGGINLLETVFKVLLINVFCCAKFNKYQLMILLTIFTFYYLLF